MSILLNNQKCCGCGACESICPKKAITLVEDDESFLYPQINQDLCIDCNLCEKTCPLSFDAYTPASDISAYVGLNQSGEALFESSSGGAFTALYEVYIRKGYRVYGVAFDQNHKVIHCGASTLEECEKFRKSKYVQSYYNNVYECIVQDLKKGTKVLFSGTSCQCAALRLYLATKRVDSQNIVIINVLCHGVPSQKMFDTYLDELQKETKLQVIRYQFKNKSPKDGKINTRTALIEFDDGTKKVREIANDAFLRGYYTRLFYRPSCAVCPFAREERLSDFTILDAWNIEKIMPEYDSLSGVSLILFNTEKSKQQLAEIQSKMTLNEVSTQWALSSQELFHEPTSMHRNRKLFFQLWSKMGFTKAVFQSTRTGWKQKLARLLPEGIKTKLKKILYK